MLTKCEQKVMEILLPRPFLVFSVRQISKLIGKSYALTYESVKGLMEKKMIKVEKIGNSLACKLNLSASPKLLAVSSLLHSGKFLTKVRFAFLIEEIEEKLSDSIYIMVLFGSWAKGKASQESDVDLLFVVQSEGEIEKMKRGIRSVLSSSNVKVDFNVITADWLTKMFGEKHSVGREVLEGSIILHGAEQYYSLVNRYDKKRGH